MADGAVTRDSGICRDGIVQGREYDLIAPIAEDVVTAAGTHLDRVGHAGSQAGKGILVGGDVGDIILHGVKRQSPCSGAVIRPGDSRALVGDVRNGNTSGNIADGRYDNVIHIPSPVFRRGIVSEGDNCTGGSILQGHNLPQEIHRGRPVVVVVSADGSEGGGVVHVGEITHCEGAVAAEGAVVRTHPEGDLQRVHLLRELREGNYIGSALVESHRILAVGGVVMGRQSLDELHVARHMSPAVEGLLRFEVVSIRDGLWIASGGGEGHQVAPFTLISASTLVLHLCLVSGAGVQVGERVRRHNAIRRHPFAAGNSMPDMEDVAFSGPIEGGGVVGVIRHGKVFGGQASHFCGEGHLVAPVAPGSTANCAHFHGVFCSG